LNPLIERALSLSLFGVGRMVASAPCKGASLIWSGVQPRGPGSHQLIG
jgi:hypothetical protein